MSASSDKQLRINASEVVWRQIDDELVVLQMTTATYLTITGAGRALWERLADGATSCQLVEALVNRFGIPSERAENDVDAFLEALSAVAVLEAPDQK